MIIVAIIVGIVLIGIICLSNYISHNELGYFNMGIFLGIVISIFLVIEMAIINNLVEEQIPTALDVYRDNTELEYTIRGGEVVDSVVVFKKK